MKRGNGYDAMGTIRPGGLFEAEVRFRRRTFAFKPYAGLIDALRRAGADVLVFPYDWRLGCHFNAALLQRAILAKWFGGGPLERGRRLSEAERITFIGHSLGGLVARYFLESPHLGRDLARRLVTIGTPHLGAPQAWLHFNGTTLPFPENPFYRWAQDMLQAQLSGAGVAAQGGVSAQLFPGKTQTDVFRYMGSAVEVLPVYDFVEERGNREPFSQTYQGAVHTGTGRPAMTIIQAFRNNVLPAPRLDAWLGQHKLEYHFLAATGFTTASGYDRGRKRILTTTSGDGTVPLASAHLVKQSTPRLRAITLATDARGHQRLCERPEVQEYCTRLLLAAAQVPPTAHGRPPVRGRPKPRVPAPGRPLTVDFVAMAKEILRRHKAPAWRGEVLSVAYLRSHDGSQLIDPTTEASGLRLKNPPKHLMGPAIEEVRSPRHGTFRFVFMQSNGQSYAGGVVFLPVAGAPDIWVVGWNTASLETGWRHKCDNPHHAEMQLVTWIKKQRPEWQASVGSMRLNNRSRRGPSRGFSPCRGCCAELTTLLAALNELPRPRKIDARISWERLYEGTTRCPENRTEGNCIRALRKDWGEPQGPRPVGARSLPPPPPPTRRRAPGGPVSTP